MNVKLFCAVVAIMSLSAGCASTAVRPDVKAPELTRSEYLQTAQGVLRFYLGYEYATYSLTLDIVRSLPAGVMLEIEFENPVSGAAAVLTKMEDVSGKADIVVVSEQVYGVLPGRNYEVTVRIYKDNQKSELLGTHRQLIHAFIGPRGVK